MRKELRTEPDVQSGIKVNDQDENVQLVTYEPGNGVRYSVILTHLGSLKSENILGDETFLVYVMNLGRGFLLPAGKIHHHFIQEKLRCSIFDAVVLTELLGYLLEVECITVEQFVQDMAG